jgi:hypothetical protein
MPTQNQPNEGDVLDTKQLTALPIGAVVRDKEDDTYDVHLPGHFVMRGDGTVWAPEELALTYGPTRLVSLPDKPDPYQEARLALRDVLGMEPDEQMIRNTMAAHRPQITTMHETAKRVTAPAEPAHEVAQSILIVTALGDETGSRLVISADTTAGLARLRAHSALDALLDQHGISR